MTFSADLAGTAGVPAARRTPRGMAWRRFRHNRGAMAGLVVLGVVVLVVLIAPLFVPYTPTAVDPDHVREGPSAAHWLGTDDTGRDTLARLLAGGQVSLLVGFAAAASALIIGTALGIVSGRAGGWLDLLITRITELFMAIPSILVVIVLAGVVGPSIGLLITLIALFTWPPCCRIARSVVLKVRELEYVQAAHAAGTVWWRILLRHLLPNVLPQVLVSGTLLVAVAILSEASLSYLGLGVTPPAASWGNMLMEVRSFGKLASQPWLWVPPGVAISLTTLSVVFIGDGLRDALDPKAASR
jgi:peptide/nickel transport system permease protein